MKKLILSHNFILGVVGLTFFSLITITLICFMWISYFLGNKSLSLTGFIILSIIFLFNGIFLFIIVGFRLVQWVVIDNHSIRSYNLLNKIDEYLWDEIQYYKTYNVYNRSNLKNFTANVYVFYKQKKYSREYIGANKKGLPLGVNINPKNLTFINDLIKTYNITLDR